MPALRAALPLVAVLGALMVPGAAVAATPVAVGVSSWDVGGLVNAPSGSAASGDAAAPIGSSLSANAASSSGSAVSGNAATPAEHGDDAADAAANPDDSALPTDPSPPTAERAWLARIVYRTGVRAGPSAASRRLGRVAAHSPWGGQNQLLVLRSARAGGKLWIDVRLPGRPNASHGWIAAEYAALSTTAWRIEVNRKSRRLSVWRGTKIAKRGPVVVGAAATPTPPGLFAIADAVRQPDPVRFVGRWVLPLTAYSEVLHKFDGGDGQAAFHGRSGASLRDPLGSARSHGCIRIDNALVAWIATKVPVGTPVTIV